MSDPKRESTSDVSRREFLHYTAATGIVALVSPRGLDAAPAASALSDLAATFTDPPDSARPWALWMWMNGHITREGITLDLEAMKRVGVGGVINFDAGTGIPKGPVEYLGPEWFALKTHAIQEAARLGLEFGMHNCPGWSSSGGPWITPELAMQQLVWSETCVEGGATVEVGAPPPFRKLGHYRDIAVIAYPSLRGEAPLRSLLKAVWASSGPVTVDDLDARDARPLVVRPAAGGGQAWLLFEFLEPYEASSVAFVASPDDGAGRPRGPAPVEGFGRRGAASVEASDDGVTFRRVAQAAGEGGQDSSVVAAEFAPVKARFFRLSTAAATGFSQVRFAAVPRFADYQKRSNAVYNGRGLQAMGDPGTDVVALDRVIDVSTHVDAGGVLHWQAPAGTWTLLRFGFTPLGTLNRSAPDTGVGLECDKYRAEAVTFHFDKMMQPLLPILAPLTKAGKMSLEVDSWEVGMQNWTPGFEAQFKTRAGYALERYLPAMTGRVVGSVDTTERFLWDLRRIQADLLADNYYGQLAKLCHQHGMKLIAEPYDRGPMEEMQIGARADVNMGEFWQRLSSIFQNNLTMRRTTKLAASVAHVNGQPVVGAESFTGEPESARWQEYPFAMKARGDMNFTRGVNRIAVHRYAHQPHPTAAPGMTMGPWGVHFERTTTWWEPGRAWLRYLARCQSLLQQGLFVADLAYFTGEDAGVYTKVEHDELDPAPPEGYDYDLIDAEVFVQKASVAAGRLHLPDGMSYRALVLQRPRTVTLGMLRKLHAFVRDGMVLVGSRPETTPGLGDHPAGDAEFARLCDELWGPAGAGGRIARRIGSGSVFFGQPLRDVLRELALERDVEISSQSGDAPITWIHRAIGGSEVYFLANQRRSDERLMVTFRVDGRTPEIWNPVTGSIAPAAACRCENGRVRAAFELPPFGSAFVVFRTPAPAETCTAVARDGVEILGTRAYPQADGPRHRDTVNDFTVTLWAKPESDVMLSTNNFMEGVSDPWTDEYAIYPPSGEELYGAGHLASGLAIGRNGVAIWERGTGKPVFALAARAPLSGWTPVAVVYRAGLPEVYIGGKLISRGQRKRGDVHPGVGPAFLRDGASYFNGDMTAPAVHPRALAEAEIAVLTHVFPGRSGSWDPIVEPTAGRRATLRVWRNGSYMRTFSSGRTSRFEVRGLMEPIVVAGPWTVEFPPDRGAPARIELAELASLHLHPDAGVRCFSGSATYRSEFRIPPPAIAPGRLLFIDLGHVAVMAEVALNESDLGVLWARPIAADITRAVRPGVNHLEVKVTNLWPNRLIGDEESADEDKFRPGGGGTGMASLSGGAIDELPDWYMQGRPKPRTSRIAFATWKHYTKGAPLLESGLIGPVVIRAAVVK